MDFATAFARLIDPQHEGGYSDDAADPGNWTGGKVGSGRLQGTKYGISAASYPTLDIASLTVDQASAVYQRDFWQKAGCDAVPDVLKFELFDTAVNSGVKAAAMMLQRALQPVYAGEVDGDIGPKTQAAIATFADPYRLLVRFCGRRLDYWNDLVNWAHDGKGWVQRLATDMMVL